MDVVDTEGRSEQRTAARQVQKVGRFGKERPVVRRTVGTRAAEMEAVLEALGDGRSIQDRVMDRVVDGLLADMQ